MSKQFFSLTMVSGEDIRKGEAIYVGGEGTAKVLRPSLDGPLLGFAAHDAGPGESLSVRGDGPGRPDVRLS